MTKKIKLLDLDRTIKVICQEIMCQWIRDKNLKILDIKLISVQKKDVEEFLYRHLIKNDYILQKLLFNVSQ